MSKQNIDQFTPDMIGKVVKITVTYTEDTGFAPEFEVGTLSGYARSGNRTYWALVGSGERTQVPDDYDLEVTVCH